MHKSVVYQNAYKHWRGNINSYSELKDSEIKKQVQKPVLLGE